VAEHEHEKPARRLSPWLAGCIDLVCALLSVLVLYQVFCPFATGTP
jgi:hypothetical protein